jgi:hypothetical protein
MLSKKLIAQLKTSVKKEQALILEYYNYMQYETYEDGLEFIIHGILEGRENLIMNMWENLGGYPTSTSNRISQVLINDFYSLLETEVERILKNANR